MVSFTGTMAKLANLSDQAGSRTPPNPAMPSFAIVMKVGPHSGMTLAEILETKHEEETVHGVHYWGYSGTACHPSRVIEFIRYVRAFQSMPPVLMLLETSSKYSSRIGKARSYSVHGGESHGLEEPIQLQGAQYAFVCVNLQRRDLEFSLDSYSVVGGKNDGVPLGEHLRSRVSKAFVRRKYVQSTSHVVRLAYTAELVEPYVISLGVA